MSNEHSKDCDFPNYGCTCDLREKSTPQFMYKDFEEYAEILGIPRWSAQWEAFEMVWNMARTPYSVLEQLSAQD